MFFFGGLFFATLVTGLLPPFCTHQQCERVLQMAERATDVLEHVTKNVQASARVKNADLANLLAGAGAFAVVGVGCYYLGCAPTSEGRPGRGWGINAYSYSSFARNQSRQFRPS